MFLEMKPYMDTLINNMNHHEQHFIEAYDSHLWISNHLLLFDHQRTLNMTNYKIESASESMNREKSC